MKQKINELRLKIDGIAQLAKTVVDKENLIPEETTSSGNFIYRTAKIRECENSLLLAKAWLGKLLGEFGSETPYKNDGKRKTVEDIEPTDAKAINLFETSGDLDSWGKDFNDKAYIEKIDYLRQEIEEVVKEVKILGSGTEGFQNIQKDNVISSIPKPILDTREKNICRTNAWTHLCEAKIHLGFELQRIRESQIKS